jgi:hypothetical protein
VGQLPVVALRKYPVAHRVHTDGSTASTHATHVGAMRHALLVVEVVTVVWDPKAGPRDPVEMMGLPLSCHQCTAAQVGGDTGCAHERDRLGKASLA